MKLERGGLILGLIIGLLVGLALALAVALYVTKAPVPFVNKVPPRTADQDAAEAERNRNWDPNAGLSGRSGTARGAEGAASGPGISGGPIATAPVTPPVATAPGAAKSPAVIPGQSSRDPAAILAGAPVESAKPKPAPAPPPKADSTAPSSTIVAMGSAASGAKASAKTAADPFVYFVQAGAFQSSAEAEQQRAKLAILGVETKIIEREQSGRMVFRVRAGPFNRQPDADAVKDKLLASNVEAMLVRVEKQNPGATAAAPR